MCMVGLFTLRDEKQGGMYTLEILDQCHWRVLADVVVYFPTTAVVWKVRV